MGQRLTSLLSHRDDEEEGKIIVDGGTTTTATSSGNSTRTSAVAAIVADDTSGAGERMCPTTRKKQKRSLLVHDSDDHEEERQQPIKRPRLRMKNDDNDNKGEDSSVVLVEASGASGLSSVAAASSDVSQAGAGAGAGGGGGAPNNSSITTPKTSAESAPATTAAASSSEVIVVPTVTSAAAVVQHKQRTQCRQKTLTTVDTVTGNIVCRRCYVGDTFKKGHAYSCYKSEYYSKNKTKKKGNQLSQPPPQSQSPTAADVSASVSLPTKARPVQQLCLQTGKVIRTYSSTHEASRVLKISPSGIRYCCNGLRNAKYAAGYGWRFATDTTVTTATDADEGSATNADEGSIPSSLQRKRQVQQLCLQTGNVIRTYSSIAEASRALQMKSPSGISYCCNGIRDAKTAAGYGWRFATDTTVSANTTVTTATNANDGSIASSSPRKRPVQQLCLQTGNVIRTYSSMAEASRMLQMSRSRISCCCNGINNSKTAAGYGWRFAAEDDDAAAGTNTNAGPSPP